MCIMLFLPVATSSFYFILFWKMCVVCHACVVFKFDCYYFWDNDGSHSLQLHFEDSNAPSGESGGINYRPDGTPTKVGLWMFMVRGRCLVYLPGNSCSYDEGTARYNGSMSKLKHRQSWFKPYDGFRIYMLNDSTTGNELLVCFFSLLKFTNFPCYML